MDAIPVVAIRGWLVCQYISSRGNATIPMSSNKPVKAFNSGTVTSSHGRARGEIEVFAAAYRLVSCTMSSQTLSVKKRVNSATGEASGANADGGPGVRLYG